MTSEEELFAFVKATPERVQRSDAWAGGDRLGRKVPFELDSSVRFRIRRLFFAASTTCKPRSNAVQQNQNDQPFHVPSNAGMLVETRRVGVLWICQKAPETLVKFGRFRHLSSF